MGRPWLRRATPADAAAIAEIHLTARREAMPWLAVVHSDEETGRWVRGVVLEEQEVWVAEGDGEDGVLGFAALGGATLEQLYVRPAAQGRGIGGALLARAKERRPGGLDLWTFQRNGPARAFYERRGFVAVQFGDGAGNEEREPDVRYRWAGSEEEHHKRTPARVFGRSSCLPVLDGGRGHGSLNPQRASTGLGAAESIDLGRWKAWPDRGRMTLATRS